MAQILAFPIPADGQWHDIPRAYAHSLTGSHKLWFFGMQDGVPTIWCRPHDLDSSTASDKLMIVGTGSEYPDVHHYVDSVQDGDVVLHLIAKAN